MAPLSLHKRSASNHYAPLRAIVPVAIVLGLLSIFAILYVVYRVFGRRKLYAQSLRPAARIKRELGSPDPPSIHGLGGFSVDHGGFHYPPLSLSDYPITPQYSSRSPFSKDVTNYPILSHGFAFESMVSCYSPDYREAALDLTGYTERPPHNDFQQQLEAASTEPMSLWDFDSEMPFPMGLAEPCFADTSFEIANLGEHETSAPNVSMHEPFQTSLPDLRAPAAIFSDSPGVDFHGPIGTRALESANSYRDPNIPNHGWRDVDPSNLDVPTSTYEEVKACSAPHLPTRDGDVFIVNKGSSTENTDQLNSVSGKPGLKEVSKPRSSFECPKCRKSFRRRHQLNKHVKTHDRSFKCQEPGCLSRGFYRLQDLERHSRGAHREDDSGSRFFCNSPDCPYATRGFSRKGNYLRHIRLQHPASLDSAQPSQG